MSVGCDEVVGLEEEEEGEDHPEHVEEDKVDPEIEPVGGVQVGIVCQPLRTKGHPAYEREGFMIQTQAHDISVSAVFVNDQGSKLVISITQPMAWVTSSICKSISKVLEPCSQGLVDFLMKD